MFRRWLIRGFLLFLLLLLLAGWGVSTGRNVGCGRYQGKNSVGCSMWHGEVAFSWLRGGRALSMWYGSCNPEPFRIVCTNFFWHFDSNVRPYHSFFAATVLGFRYVHSGDSSKSIAATEGYVVAIPFWFLIVVTGTGLGYAWKKTGPRRVARGFPVQASGGGLGTATVRERRGVTHGRAAP